MKFDLNQDTIITMLKLKPTEIKKVWQFSLKQVMVLFKDGTNKTFNL